MSYLYLSALISQSFLDIGSLSRILDSIMKPCLQFCRNIENQESSAKTSELEHIIEAIAKEYNFEFTLMALGTPCTVIKVDFLHNLLMELIVLAMDRFDYMQMLLDAEFGIIGEKLGSWARSIHGIGVFPCMETSSSSTLSSMASSSELSAIYDQLKMLSTNFVTLQKENEDLRAQLRAVLTASHGETSTSSRGSNGVHSNNDYYDELANHNLDEN